jgi:regulator of sirC expression with transglutaminase-like and TPR domain
MPEHIKRSAMDTNTDLDTLDSRFDPDIYLKYGGTQEDQDIDLVLCAFAFALLFYDKTDHGVVLERYAHHIKLLCDAVFQEHKIRLKQVDVEDDAALRVDVMQSVLYEEHGYIGDVEDYDHLQNASLLRVIDRRRGLPVTLSLLYTYVARKIGWDMQVLALPGHIVCRMDVGADRILFDPFNACKILNAPDLRFIVKQALGNNAELSASYMEPASNREILIRLQNNIKQRQMVAEDYEAALKTVQMMQVIDGDEYRLCLDAGVLYARNNQALAAIRNLERYIEEAPYAENRRDAILLLNNIKESLN